METSVQAEINRLAAKAFVESLISTGIENVCITPGSRSAPLTIQFAEQSTIQPWLHLDERSAAFFALGLAKKNRKTSCTTMYIWYSCGKLSPCNR